MTKKSLLAPLFVAASFLLIACSSEAIVARPAWMDDPIVSGDDLKDNTLKEIYDAIKELGDTNANVLNKVMYDIAQKQIGHFIGYTDKDGNKHLGLSDFAPNKTPTNEQIDQFVKDYPMYASEDKGYVTGNDKEVELNDNQKRMVSREKIINQYNIIVESIFEKLYDDIKGGDYCALPDKKLFKEAYFVDHLEEEMYSPEVGEISLATNRALLPKRVETWKEYVNYHEVNNVKYGFLHVMDGDGNFNNIYFPHTTKEPDGGYIGRKILPDVYRTLLIEKYVREQRYINLGRSYARKVNMITIPYSNSAQGDYILSMLDYFAKTYITGEDEAKPKKIIDDEYNLEHLTHAMIGFAWKNATLHSDEMDWSEELLSKGAFQKVQAGGADLIWKVRTNVDGTAATDFVSSNVYKGTKLGDLAEKYLLTQNVKYTKSKDTWEDFSFTMKDHFDSEAQSAYDDITNKGAYDLETGLIIKEREIRMTDMTQDGWFLKSGGLTDLNEEFRDKLYNIKTSNGVDDVDYIKSPTVISNNDTVRYFGDLTDLADLSNRRAFLRAEGNTPFEQIVLNDKKSNFYIIEVKEAASASKLSLDDINNSYLKLKATSNLGESNGLTDEIVHNVTKQVANSDTYKKNAEQYYLMISNILFYDQSVYDYFKSQFPELFK